MATKDQSGLVLQQAPWGSGTLLPGLCGTSHFCLFRFISSSWRNWPAGSFLGCGVWEVKQFWELPWLKTSLCYPPTWSMLWLLLGENHFCSEAWRRGSTFHFLFPCDCSVALVGSDLAWPAVSRGGAQGSVRFLHLLALSRGKLPWLRTGRSPPRPFPCSFSSGSGSYSEGWASWAGSRIVSGFPIFSLSKTLRSSERFP